MRVEAGSVGRHSFMRAHTELQGPGRTSEIVAAAAKTSKRRSARALSYCEAVILAALRIERRSRCSAVGVRTRNLLCRRLD